MKKRAKLLVSIMCAAICLAGLVTSVWAAVQTEFNFNTTIKFDASNQVFVDIKGEAKIGGEVVSTYTYTHSTTDKSSKPSAWNIGSLYFYDTANADGSHTYSSKTVKPSDRIEICLEITNYSLSAVSATFTADGIEDNASWASNYSNLMTVDTIEAPYIYEQGDDTTPCTHRVVKIYTLEDLSTSFTSVANNLTVAIEKSTLTPANASSLASYSGDTMVISKTDGSSLQSVGGWFATVSAAVKTLILPGTMTSVPNGNYTNLETVIMSSGTTAIASSAFSSASLKNILMPESCVTLNSGCFSGCTSLKNIYFGNITSSSIWTTSNLASDASLKYLEFPSTVTTVSMGYIPNSVTTLKINEGTTTINSGGSGLTGASSLKTLFIPKTVTSISLAGPYSICSSLETVEVDSDNANYCSVDGIVYNKAKTSLVYVPRQIQMFTFIVPSTVSTLPGYIFANTNIESVILPETLTSISSNVFNTSKVKYIEGNGITTLGTNALYFAMGLEQVNFPALVTIGDSAFGYCSKLKSITIPAGVTSIGSGAFSYCSTLTEVYMEGDAPTIVQATFGASSSAPYTNAGFKIYVKEQYRSSYTQTSTSTSASIVNWSYYQDKLEYLVV